MITTNLKQGPTTTSALLMGGHMGVYRKFGYRCVSPSYNEDYQILGSTFGAPLYIKDIM